MKEIEDIIKAFKEAQKHNKQTALATVVHVHGSSYRQAGARMLVTEDGQLTGAISGGCLEGDALRKALHVMNQQKPMLVTYDTTDEDDAKLGVGLGCNGIIQILIEPVNPDNALNPVALLERVLSKRQKAVIVTVFSLENRKGLQPGSCLLQLETGEAFTTFTSPQLETKLLADCKETLATQASSVKEVRNGEDTFTAFIELLMPPVSLVVIGAGNDVIPLTQMAGILGWRMTIVDGRANYATAARFPLAHNIVVAKPEKAITNIEVDNQTVFLLMTHNYNYDLAILRQLLDTSAVYTGILGPRKKLERMLKELRDEGRELSEDQTSKIYAPVGLEIGAEAAEEIALSILAEIKAVLTKKSGQFLRERQDTIHERTSLQIL
jgi:xanthine/CO dehydrogenase XdhC/CoxF family maturation factor